MNAGSDDRTVTVRAHVVERQVNTALAATPT
jgi:hypothetical protein